MPELPEVETVKRALESFLPGQRLTKVEAFREDLRFPIPKKALGKLKGARLSGLRRRGKYLLFDFEDQVFLSHLGMTGNWREETSELRKHDHLVLHFERSRLVYNDPRRFGYVDVYKKNLEPEHIRLRHLGVEPLSAEFTGAYLKAKAFGKESNVKSFLMNNEVVVGIGNIYAVESLFRAGVSPKRSVARLTKPRFDKLVAAAKEVLTEAILAGGSTIRDFRSSTGESGYFQLKLDVYGRGAEPCRKCQAILRHQSIAGRATVWCPKCQK